MHGTAGNNFYPRSFFAGPFSKGNLQEFKALTDRFHRFRRRLNNIKELHPGEKLLCRALSLSPLLQLPSFAGTIAAETTTTTPKSQHARSPSGVAWRANLTPRELMACFSSLLSIRNERITRGGSERTLGRSLWLKRRWHRNASANHLSRKYCPYLIHPH